MKVNISGCTRSAQENTFQIDVKVLDSKGSHRRHMLKKIMNEFDARLVTPSRKSLALFAQQTPHFAITRSVPTVVMLGTRKMSLFVTKRTMFNVDVIFWNSPFNIVHLVAFISGNDRN
jgi:hypothetical protein